jgi:LuxR family transcriptional regulator, maltose regulon positive regulatory protein
MKPSEPIPVLLTKIQPPRSFAGLLDRPRLLALLPLVRSKQLTVVKAPAGFGKTSIAVAWAERLRLEGGLVAWFGLDQDDDEPSRFLYYVAQALRRAHESLGSTAIDMIEETSLLPPGTVTSTLINELAERDDDVYLFLDDYHLIADAAIHEGLYFLLRHASSNFHLVLTARTEPPLPLARMRVQNQLLEVDATALRFDLAETRRFLEQAQVGGFNPSDLMILHSTTDGWPAALRLVASASLQGEGGLQPLLQSMPAVSRPIGAYIEDLLAMLPAEMIDFMTRVSILDRFNAGLCDAVTGTASSQRLLQSIVRSQLLLTPLGQEGNWYRYHPLLAEFLRQRMEARHGAELPELHRRAARWFASNELWTDAVAHAIAAGETSEALNWIEHCAMAMVKRGELLTLLGWQRQLPSGLMRGQLSVRLAIAWGMALAMRFDDALALLEEIKADIPHRDPSAWDDIASECQTIRSVVLALQDDTHAALSVAEPCLQRHAPDPWNTNVASNVVRLAQWRAGNLEAFYAVPWLPYSTDDDHRNLLSQVYRLCLHGLVELEQLRFDVAERHCLEALRQGEQHVGPQSTAAALPASLIARIRYEQGRLDEAEAMIGERLPAINATAMLECVLTTYIVLARIAASRSNVERAYVLLEQADKLGSARRWGRLIAAAQVERITLFLNERRLTEASACVIHLDRLAVEYPVTARCAWSDIASYRSLARAHVALATGFPREAVAILSALREDALGARRLYFGLRLDALLAAALLDAGEPIKAVEQFHNVVKLAAPAGIYRTLLDSGPAVGLMLPRLRENLERKADSRPLLEYVDHLLEGWRTLHQSGPVRGHAHALADSLTTRERSILELIAEGRSNKEIARSLGIAPETVKSHLKNIFGKLSVEKRAQAIARAQSLGLLRTV